MRIRIYNKKAHSTTPWGSVLIFTLWILVCLSLIALGFGHRVRLETKATAYTIRSTEALYMAEKAVYDKIMEMIEYVEAEEEGEYAETAYVLPEEEPEQGDADIRYRVVAEEGRLNVNIAPEEMIRNLEPLKGSIARAIIKRRAGEDKQLGTEDDALFRIPEELLVQEKIDIDPEEWHGEENDDDETPLKDLVTVYGDGRIDLNSAPREVLEAIPDARRRVVDDIIEARVGEDGVPGTEDDKQWKSSKEFAADTELSATELAPFVKYGKFGSQFYTVTVIAGREGTPATARVRAVVQIIIDEKEEKKAPEFTIVSWRED